MTTTSLPPVRVETIDLRHLGHANRIASYLLDAPDGPVLVETGPASCLPTLVAALADHGIEPEDVRHVFLTHVHLDHAGAAGWWAARGTDLFVHPRGAPHLVDPSRLLASAARLYGDRMDELWGETLPAPPARVHAVEDGATVDAAGLEIQALATPGHAEHHNVYRVGDLAFVGDLAAIVVPGTPLVELPTPPPEFDLARWQASLASLIELRLSALYPTHFGRVDDATEHLAEIADLLDEAAHLLRRALAEGSTAAQLRARFRQWNRRRLERSGGDDTTIDEIEAFNPPELSVAGIVRYWGKQLGLQPED